MYVCVPVYVCLIIRASTFMKVTFVDQSIVANVMSLMQRCWKPFWITCTVPATGSSIFYPQLILFCM